MQPASSPLHPVLTRRSAIQAGTIGLLGLGMGELSALQALAAGAKAHKARTCIFIFLSGGLAQHDSFDLKPDAADGMDTRSKTWDGTAPEWMASIAADIFSASVSHMRSTAGR